MQLQQPTQRWAPQYLRHLMTTVLRCSICHWLVVLSTMGNVQVMAHRSGPMSWIPADLGRQDVNSRARHWKSGL